jgi:DNA-binding NarL/FixJ family response regulator
VKRRSFLKGTAASLAVLATARIAELVREGNAARPWFAPLTARQAHVSELLAAGLTNTEIATYLGISVRTTDAHVYTIFRKLWMHRRQQVAEWVLRSRPSEKRSAWHSMPDGPRT